MGTAVSPATAPAIALCAALLVTAQPTAQKTAPPRLDAVLERAAAYVARFARNFSNVVAEERYLQQSSGRRTAAGSGRGSAIVLGGDERRELVSDFLLVKLAGNDTWVQFRDVFELNGRPVREREERLAKILLQSTAAAMEQAQQILDESTRYNLGDITRTINMPLIALYFFDARQQPRFRFTLGKEDASIEPGIWVVEYDERVRPTFVHTPDGRELFTSGRAWVEASSGLIVQTEIVLQVSGLRASVTTSFKPDERFGFDVPAEMNEDYRLNRLRITGRATYGRFRRFDVTSEEKTEIPSPVR